MAKSIAKTDSIQFEVQTVSNENQQAFADMATQLNESAAPVLILKGEKEGFEMAFIVASAIQNLQTLLTPAYMKPIMALQGNRLGFKTDKDEHGGYIEAVVKNCVIEAVLMGVQVVGNQFNIIQGNCYITKEGFGFLLKKVDGLSYDIVPGLPRINNDKTGAAVDMEIRWEYVNRENSKKTKTLPIAVKHNQYQGVDAVIGKATRKARAWLYNTITGSEISDGDITDLEAATKGAAERVTRGQQLNQQAEDAIAKLI